MKFSSINLFLLSFLFAMPAFSKGVTLPEEQTLVDPFKVFYGNWVGTGQVMGMASKAELSWDLVLDGKFHRLRFKNIMSTPDGKKRMFEGHAYYQVTGKNSYKGTWFDSRGVEFKISGKTEFRVLTSDWGDPKTEQGRTTYSLLKDGTLEVVDSVKGPNGEYSVFGKITFKKK